MDIAPNALGRDIPYLEANLWDLPSIRARYGFCVDVMEHIPPERVDQVLENIQKSVTESVFFQIALFKDGGSNLVKTDSPLHLTVEKAEFWAEKMRKYFDVPYEDPGNRYYSCLSAV